MPSVEEQGDYNLRCQGCGALLPMEAPGCPDCDGRIRSSRLALRLLGGAMVLAVVGACALALWTDARYDASIVALFRDTKTPWALKILGVVALVAGNYLLLFPPVRRNR